MNASTAPKNRTQALWAWVCGILFESALIAAFLGDFKEGWLLIQLHNFAVVSHAPFVQFAAVMDSPVVVAPLLVGYVVLLTWLWAALFGWIAKVVKGRFFRNGISRNQRFIGALGCVGMAFIVQPAVVAYFDKPREYTPSMAMKPLVDGNSLFALDLYQRLKEQPGNLFFSPYSISKCMGMVYAGARGNTERELAAVRHFNLPQTNLHAAFGEVATRLQGLQHRNRITLRQADSLWYQHDFPIAPAFVNLIGANYQGELKAVDFKNTAQAASVEMASWIDKKTGGKLNGTIPDGVITRETRLVLCDTIYFKGRWASEFSHGKTEPRNFSITTNQTVTVPMMSQEAEFKMAQTHREDVPILKALELPYYGRDLSMIILLPDEVDGLADIEQDLNATNLSAWLAELDKAPTEKADVSIPRFSFQRSLNLGNELKGMGVGELFSIEKSDLSGMEPGRNLYVSDVLHQAFVDVNEHGTEATAMTVAIAKVRGMTRSFTANHPFIFLIREKATGSILFLGRMANPSKS